MRKYKSTWKKYPLWKKAATIAALVLAVVIFLDFTGYVNSGIKSWVFEKAYKERMAKIAELEKDNTLLRTQLSEYEAKVLELKAKDALFEAREKALDAATKKDLDRLEKAIAEQLKAEQETAKPVSNKLRCLRLRDKLIDLKIKGAGDINCDEY